MTNKKELIDSLQRLYDNNSLSDEDEGTILDTLEYLGGKEKLNW